MEKDLEKVTPQFPEGGIPLLPLVDVYLEHGPEVGWSELQRRSVCPPMLSSEAKIDAEIRRQVGPLSLTVDYVELSH